MLASHVCKYFSNLDWVVVLSLLRTSLRRLKEKRYRIFVCGGSGAGVFKCRVTSQLTLNSILNACPFKFASCQLYRSV